jgi:3-hydroxybutyryl-CoA dehydrogenase
MSDIIAVVGAGVMGSDLALDLARFGYSVVLKDLDQGILARSREKIKRTLKSLKITNKEFAACSIEEILSRIQFATTYDGFANASFVLENITENYEFKKELFGELGGRCHPGAIFGSNTSCISITKMAALLPRPENVIGMHFLNPEPLKKLVEVIRGFQTSDETLEKTQAFLKTMGKTWVVVNDFPGFVTNRVLMLTINECVFLVQDKVASPESIDRIFTQGFSHKMGPLATADLIGLDTILNSLEVLFDSYKDPKFRPCPLLRKMVDAGLLGKKSGRGFFEYPH